MKFTVKALSLFLLVSSGSARIGQEFEQEPSRRLIRAADGNKIENQYIVTLTKNVEPSVLASSLVGRNPHSKILHEYNDAYRGFAVSGMTEEDMLNLAAQNPDSILEIEEDSLVYASQVQVPWNLDRIDGEGLDNSYTTTVTGAGVKIYVVDTGSRISHDDFGGRGEEGMDFTGENNGVDSHGHGTHVASTAAGSKYGVAPGATVIPVKVLGRDGSGSNSGVIAGIDWVASQTASSGKTSVANLSLGGGRSVALNRAVAAATAKGVVMVVAAGNEDSNACTSSPASEQSAITVGSTMRIPLDTRSSFSNWGRCVNIFAPGSDIKAAWSTTDSATNTISGTSMASPHVAGAMALILEANPGIDAIPAGENLLAMAITNAVRLKGLRPQLSPNLLLYTGDIGNTQEADSVEQGQTQITMKINYGASASETRMVLYQQRSGLWTKQETWEEQGAVGDLVVSRNLSDGYYAFYLYDAGGDGLDGGGSFSLFRGEANESDDSNVFAVGGEFESWVSVEFRVLDGAVTETNTKSSGAAE